MFVFSSSVVFQRPPAEEDTDKPDKMPLCHGHGRFSVSAQMLHEWALTKTKRPINPKLAMIRCASFFLMCVPLTVIPWKSFWICALRNGSNMQTSQGCCDLKSEFSRRYIL